MAEKLVNKAGLEEFASKVKEKAVFIDSESGGSAPEGMIKTSDLQDGSVTTDKIANGAVTAGKLDSNIVIPEIIMSTTDIGEGADLAEGTFYGVYV